MLVRDLSSSGEKAKCLKSSEGWPTLTNSLSLLSTSIQRQDKFRGTTNIFLGLSHQSWKWSCHIVAIMPDVTIGVLLLPL
jgi:hypothetical protein